MVSRVTGALAVTGGVAWLVKVALIWQNGGTNTTEGLVGLLFTVGAVGVYVAAALRGWYLRSSATVGRRLLTALLALVAVLAAVDLPILLAWQVIGHVWATDEVGIVLTAVAAIAVGQRWWRIGWAPATGR